MAPSRSRLPFRPAAAHAGDAAGGHEAVGHEADGHEPELDLERVVFFSDAVFAIAITLLVLDLRIPDLPEHASQDTIRAALGAATPRIFAWVLSFATIGLYWMAHWRKFRAIERTDERLAAINLLLLGVIAFVPFPTGLIGAHGDEPLVVILYALTLATAGILGSVSWVYARWAGLTRPGIDDRFVRRGAFRGITVPIVMLGSLALLPFVSTSVVEASWLLIFPVQIVINRLLSR
jgi:uncharacterized membrane protein